MLYIDAFNHILPKKYQAVLEQKVPNRDMSSTGSVFSSDMPGYRSGCFLSTRLSADNKLCPNRTLLA